MTQKPPVPSTKPSLHLNWEDWLPYFEDEDITEDQKRQIIEALWAVVLAFVDLGWETGSDAKTSGQDVDLTAFLRAAMITSEDNAND